MKLTYTFRDLTVHVVQHQRVPLAASCEYHGDVVVVTLREADEVAEPVTKVEGIKTVGERR